MPLIILQYPILRHYAGSVFDVEENSTPSEWYEERLSPKGTYWLPDGGKGLPTEISFADTALCPPSVLEGVDLMTGPCRVTSAKAVIEDSKWGENQVVLSENKQIFNITDLFEATHLGIFDRKTNHKIQEKAISTPSLFLDFSAFSIGFYEIKIFRKNEILYTITFIKCFPLVVTLDPKTGHYTTMKTIW